MHRDIQGNKVLFGLLPEYLSKLFFTAICFAASSLFLIFCTSSCSKSYDNKQFMLLLADAQQASERASEAANKAREISKLTEQNTLEAGNHLQQAEEFLRSTELKAAEDSARKTIKVAEQVPEIGSGVTRQTETTFSEADKVNEALSNIKTAFERKIDDADLLEAIEVISKRTVSAVDLAETSDVEVGNYRKLAEEYKKKAEAILQLLTEITEAERLFQQIKEQVTQAEKSVHIAEDAALEIKVVVEKIEQAQKKGDKLNILKYSEQVDTLSTIATQSDQKVAAYTGTVEKLTHNVRELTGYITGELRQQYGNADVLDYVERIAVDAGQATNTIAVLSQEVSSLANLAGEQAKHTLAEISVYLETSTSDPNQQDYNRVPQQSKQDSKSKIDLALLPKLPPMPVLTSKPRGLLIPKNEPPPVTTKTMERLQQVCNNHEPDFLPGGYAESEFYLRADNILEVRRFFGDNKDVSMIWRMDYRWNEDHTYLLLGNDPKRRPPDASLEGFTIKDIGVKASTATESFPVELPYEKLPDGRIQLGKKIYSHSLDTKIIKY